MGESEEKKRVRVQDAVRALVQHPQGLELMIRAHYSPLWVPQAHAARRLT